MSGTFVIPWQSAEEDDLLGWGSPPLTDYVVQRTGWYDIVAAARRGMTAVASLFFVELRVNGVAVARADQPTTQFVTGLSISRHQLLTAGDIVTVACTMGTAPATSQLQVLGSYLALSRIGPLRWTG